MRERLKKRKSPLRSHYAEVANVSQKREELQTRASEGEK